MLSDVEDRWSRELRADVELSPVAEGWQVSVDGFVAYVAMNIIEAERFLQTLTKFDDADRDGF